MIKLNTFVFCDETKFYLNNNNLEESIYYFGIAIETQQVLEIKDKLFRILRDRGVKIKIYHSTRIFKRSRPRIELMADLTDLLINYNLQCFYHRYEKNIFFDKTQSLRKFNNDIINFNKVEFQALFFFMTNLNIFLKDRKPNLLKKDIRMYFDRNVYGIKETESFFFPNDKFIISDMTSCEKSKIDLLFLPDFFGYIFRKSIEYLNKSDDNIINKNAHENYLKIQSSKNIHHLNIPNKIIEQNIDIIKN